MARIESRVTVGRRGTAPTFFAPAERASDESLSMSLRVVSSNPVMNGVLKSVNGILMVLNEQRQIVLVNNALLQMIGIDTAQAVFGLRPGEAIRCVHAGDTTGGCGTTKYCSTCGAAVAIVSSLALDEPVERKCAATVEMNGRPVDLCFRVRACPISVIDLRFVMLFIQDISAQERWRALERTFYHDMSNLMTALVGASELLSYADERGKDDLAATVVQVSARMQRELELQKMLFRMNADEYCPSPVNFTLQSVSDDMKNLFTAHPAAKGKSLDIGRPVPQVTLFKDQTMVLRVVTNMVLNAFEASPAGGRVRLSIETTDGEVVFRVHNSGVIPDEIARRVFQRYFSTKDGDGRGIGTFAMKLLGEQYLGGKVDFTSTAKDGTEFTFALPFTGPPAKTQ